MGKVLLWLLWVVELLLFVAGAGCIVVLSSLGRPGFDIAMFMMITLLIAFVALGGYGLVKAAQTMSGTSQRFHLAIYLLIPVVAAFLFSGSCVIFMNF